MREIKFRIWSYDLKKILPVCQMDIDEGGYIEVRPMNVGGLYFDNHLKQEDYELMQYTGLKDSKGVEIYEGDILEFTDKWEWYRTEYGPRFAFVTGEEREAIQKEYDAEPMERRVVEIPKDYEWLLSDEIQSYWEVVGNRFQHPDLLQDKGEE